MKHIWYVRPSKLYLINIPTHNTWLQGLGSSILYVFIMLQLAGKDERLCVCARAVEGKMKEGGQWT